MQAPKIDDPNIQTIPVVSLDDTVAEGDDTVVEIDDTVVDSGETIAETVSSAIPVEMKQLCSQTTRSKIKGSLMKKFTKDVQEYIFQNNSSCSFQIYLLF